MHENQKQEVTNNVSSKKSDTYKIFVRTSLDIAESIVTEQLFMTKKLQHRINRQGAKTVVELIHNFTNVKKEPKLEIAPGFKLHNFLTSICPKSFSERELDALHADSIELYFEKLRVGDVWGAKRVAISMRFWMLWTVLGGAVAGVFSMIRGKQKSSE